MRLIDVKQTLKGNAIAFDNQDPEDVKYVTLSHCWGRPDGNNAWIHDDQEYTYQDALASLPSMRKPAGFGKIIRTCELARKAKIKYVWIDTCCLDQANISEVAHGINSMFEWYRKSSFCVVYLADVTWTPSINRNDLRRQLSNSRWFERAWTLQELIAPKEVRFYNRDWNYIDSKTGLADEIYTITHIDYRILRGTSACSMCSIAHRMSWAANRKASKPEDLAYSLLGIFNVHLPMIYGEGLRSAFHRLQQAITMTTSELSIFGWSARNFPNNNISNIFANSPADFASSHDLIGNIPEKHYELTNKGVLITYILRKVRFEERDRRYYRLFLPIGYRTASGGQPDVIGIFLRKIDNEVFMRADAGPPKRYTHDEYQKFSKTPMQKFYIVSSLDDYHSRMSVNEDAIFIPQNKNIEIIKAAPEAAWDHERGMLFSRPFDESATGVLLKISPNGFPGEKVKVVVLFDRKESPPRCQVIKMAEDPEFQAFISFLFGSGERVRWDAIPAYYKRLEKEWPSQAEVDAKDNSFQVTATLSKDQRDNSYHLNIETDVIYITPPPTPLTRAPSPTSPILIDPDELLARLRIQDYDTMRENLQRLYPGLFPNSAPLYNPSSMYALNNLTASVESFIANP
ncbi:heterokaryon incompatibility protein-domain-containing protein [Hypoxylon rubiginosum]|uniref:Heterokaryon incompatibility protein-domain-containing protein n=1 Tax=Hypoxylon rubiginosum TaxID=110542 RepID=A0ACC0CKA4_9PEZI|nr:heterokaryon incompatibility protein-domain-containing protein [Hypoxylon rubiginosum]